MKIKTPLFSCHARTAYTVQFFSIMVYPIRLHAAGFDDAINMCLLGRQTQQQPSL